MIAPGLKDLAHNNVARLKGFGTLTRLFCLALLVRTQARANREKERARTETRVLTWELSLSGRKEIEITRGYGLTFGGTDGSILGRKGWFDAFSKGMV
jgi:hypothetical protein